MLFVFTTLSLNSQLATQRFGFPLHEEADFWFDSLPGCEGTGWDTCDCTVVYEYGVFTAYPWVADPDVPESEPVTLHHGPCSAEVWKSYFASHWEDYLCQFSDPDLSYYFPR